MPERRTEPRFQLNDEIQLYTGSSAVPSTALIVDISENGIGLVNAGSLTVGDVVRIEVYDHVVLGNVTRCERMGQGYSAGIELVHSIGRAKLIKLMEHYFKVLRALTEV